MGNIVPNKPNGSVKWTLPKLTHKWQLLCFASRGGVGKKERRRKKEKALLILSGPLIQ